MFDGSQYGLPWIGLILLLLGTPFFVARRLSAQTHTQSDSNIFTDSLPFLLPAALIFMEGLFSRLGTDSSWVLQLAPIGCLAVIYLLVATLFTPPKNRPVQVATSRILTVCYLSSAIIVGFLSKGYYHEEKRQISLDTLNARATPLMTHLESLYLDSLKKESRDFIEKWRRKNPLSLE